MADIPNPSQVLTQAKSGLDWKFIVKFLVALIVVNFILELLVQVKALQIIPAFVARPYATIQTLLGKVSGSTGSS